MFSGLRLEELMTLSWEADADISAVFTPSMIPMISITLMIVMMVIIISMYL